MGNYKSANKYVDNTKLPILQPEPDYQVKTRPPNLANNSWHINILLRVREEELSDEAMPRSRRKCYRPIMTFSQCRIQEGFFWYVFNCQQQFNDVAVCLQKQFDVQMDKLRRDMKRNHQPWWKAQYDQNGEVGKQAQMIDEQYGLYDSLRFTLFGIQKQRKLEQNQKQIPLQTAQNRK